MVTKKVRRRKHKAPPKQRRIDKIIISYLDELTGGGLSEGERVPGVAVAVRWNKKIVHLNCYGYANLEIGTKIKPDTVFDLGSLSKQFTAAAVYNLVIHNQVDIYEKLRPRAKGWYDKALKKSDHWYPGMPDRRRKEITNKDVLRWLATKK